MSNHVDDVGGNQPSVEANGVKSHRKHRSTVLSTFTQSRFPHGLLGVVALVLCASAAVGLSISPTDDTADPAATSESRTHERAARGLSEPREDSTTFDGKSPSPKPTQEAPKPNDAQPKKEPKSDKKTPTVPAHCQSYSGHQATACGLLDDHGYQVDQMECLATLWSNESGWDPQATNPSSGAYGIPQALPGEKMASAGEDWSSNAATQIEWGLGYISDRYGDPCGALGFWQANNYY